MNLTRDDITFDYGLTVGRDAVEADTIYLDGVVRGPLIDTEHRVYSFDHHGDCVRMATLATCQQVRTALELGLDPAGKTIVLNDLDTDASLALWLLRHPERVTEERIGELVSEVGFIDAHGPVRPVPALMDALEHAPDEVQTAQMLWADQDLIDRWYEGGDESLPDAPQPPSLDGFGVTRNGDVDALENLTGIADVYDRGYVAGVLAPPAADGTIGYFVAKRSDFVSFDVQAFLAAMNEREDGWGGGSTVGGAPRREDGRRSEVGRDAVGETLREIAAAV